MANKNQRLMGRGLAMELVTNNVEDLTDNERMVWKYCISADRKWDSSTDEFGAVVGATAVGSVLEIGANAVCCALKSLTDKGHGFYEKRGGHGKLGVFMTDYDKLKEVVTVDDEQDEDASCQGPDDVVLHVDGDELIKELKRVIDQFS